MSLAACLRAFAGGLALMTSACAGTPEPSAPDNGLIACGDMLARNAAYVQQHVKTREDRKMVMRFASEAAMIAYDAASDSFTVLGIDLVSMRNVIEAERGLPDDTAIYTFDQTTDEEAGARIAEAKACADRYLG